MSQERLIGSFGYRRASMLLAKMFEFNSDIEKQINGYIQACGIFYFFEHLNDFELSGDILIKLQAVRTVLLSVEMAVNNAERGEAANACKV